MIFTHKIIHAGLKLLLTKLYNVNTLNVNISHSLYSNNKFKYNSKFYMKLNCCLYRKQDESFVYPKSKKLLFIFLSIKILEIIKRLTAVKFSECIDNKGIHISLDLHIYLFIVSSPFKLLGDLRFLY